MKKWVFPIVLLFILLAQNFLYGQSKSDTLANFYYSKAKACIEKENFKDADNWFKKSFKQKTVLPDELAYYYGVTQLKLNRYALSRVAFQKYITLQGNDGPLSRQAFEALTEADCIETGYRNVKIDCDICFGDSTIEISCRTCKGKGIEACTLCKGAGVSKTTSSFGTSFQTCKRCDGEKIIKCTTCKGKLKEQTKCYNCNGVGHKTIRKKCSD